MISANITSITFKRPLLKEARSTVWWVSLMMGFVCEKAVLHLTAGSTSIYTMWMPSCAAFCPTTRRGTSFEPSSSWISRRKPPGGTGYSPCKYVIFKSSQQIPRDGEKQKFLFLLHVTFHMLLHLHNAELDRPQMFGEIYRRVQASWRNFYIVVKPRDCGGKRNCQ